MQQKCLLDILLEYDISSQIADVLIENWVTSGSNYSVIVGSVSDQIKKLLLEKENISKCMCCSELIMV